MEQWEIELLSTPGLQNQVDDALAARWSVEPPCPARCDAHRIPYPHWVGQEWISDSPAGWWFTRTTCAVCGGWTNDGIGWHTGRCREQGELDRPSDRHAPACACGHCPRPGLTTHDELPDCTHPRLPWSDGIEGDWADKN